MSAGTRDEEAREPTPEEIIVAEHAAIRSSVRAAAALTGNTVVLNGLAAVIATYGLFADSAAVVIGAMVVATLLGPILGVGLSIAEGAPWHLARSLRAMAAGAFTVFFTALMVGRLHTNFPLTDEIMQRTAPNLSDLVIALAGGAAGTIVTTSPRIGSAVVGVAIATALVPPLAAGSILLARAEYALASGAILLACTNMVAITFSSSVAFWIAGYRRSPEFDWRDVRGFAQRNALTIILLLVLGAGFGVNLGRTVEREVYEATASARLRDLIVRLPGQDFVEAHFETRGDVTIVRAVVRGETQPTPDAVAALERALPDPPGGTTELRIRFIPTITIGRTGVISDAGGPAGLK